MQAKLSRARMIAAYAPGSVSNVACGFDVLGFAMDEPGDIVIAGQKDDPGVRIDKIHGDAGRYADTTGPSGECSHGEQVAL